MDRRRFLVTSLAGVISGPLAATAQSTGKVARVSILHLTASTPPIDGFRHALRDLGWREGRSVVVEYRGADGKAERLEELAAEIVKSRPDVIVTGTSGAVVAAKKATVTIPIVMAVSVDPVRLGVVRSLAYPGATSPAKPSYPRAQCQASRAAPGSASESGANRDLLEYQRRETGRRAESRSRQDAARALGLQLVEVEVVSPDALDAAYQEVRGRAVQCRRDDPERTGFRRSDRRLAELALAYRVPVLSSESGFAQAGGLMNYGDSIEQAWRGRRFRLTRSSRAPGLATFRSSSPPSSSSSSTSRLPRRSA